MKKSAFTLIELLVVIAIIAILAGIALPVFNKVQERSKATSDASNLRQLGLGIQGYLNDNDEQLFSGPTGAGGGGGTTSWPNSLNPKYVSSWKVFRSPFDKVTRTRPDSEAVSGAPVPVSYGINMNALGVNASKFVSPSQLIIAAPVPVPGAQAVEFNTTSAVNPVLMMPASPSQKQGTHNGRASINALFADTHVAQMQWLDFATVMTEDGRKRWFPTGEQPEQ